MNKNISKKEMKRKGKHKGQFAINERRRRRKVRGKTKKAKEWEGDE